MINRIKLSQDTLAQTDEQLKTMSMADMGALFCNIVKAPTAPKFSDKTAAIKRIRKMAEQVIRDADVAGVPILDEILAVKPAKKAGRPKASAKVYTFLVDNLTDSDHYTRLPKQAKSILSHMVPGTDIPESELKDIIHQLAVDGKMQTKQDPWRIFQYYRSQMISSSFLRMTNAN